MRVMVVMQLLPAPSYIQDATDQIRRSKRRIAVLAMVIADHPATHEFFQAVLEAARRGVEVHVAGDIFTYGEVSGSFLPIRYYSPPARSTSHMVKLLKRAGVHFQWLGRSQISILSGRTHSKWCIVDDVVYTFGGVNLFETSITDFVDYMFKVRSPILTDRLFAEHLQIERVNRTGGLVRSHQFDIGNDHILVDGGIFGDSIIYRRALDLAESAQRIRYVSQYPPIGRLARLIYEKQDGLYFNEPKNTSPLNRMIIRISMFRNRLQTQYRGPAYLHAKFIIFYMADGTRVALTGSHNFNFGSVALGTREIALETRQASIIDQLESFLETKI